MTGNKIYHCYNGKFDWVDELDFRGMNRKHDKRRKMFAKHAKHKEKNTAKRAIQNELANLNITND